MQHLIAPPSAAIRAARITTLALLVVLAALPATCDRVAAAPPVGGQAANAR